jgi:hypothetical protein
MSGNPVKRLMAATHNSATATLFMMRVGYWWPRAKVERKGRKWIAKSREEWGDETGLSLKQVKQALSVLRELHLIETEQHLFGGKNVVFLSVTDRGEQALKGPAEWSLEGPLYIQEDTTGSYLEDNSGETPSGLTEGKPDMKLVPGQKANEVLQNYQQTKSMQKLHGTGPVENLITVWKVMLPGYIGEFTLKQKGMLGKFNKQCPSGKAELVLKAVLKDWVGFAKTVETDAGLFKVPVKPKIEFLLQHASAAVSFAKTTAEPKGQAKGTKVPSLQLSAEPAEGLASLEDILKPPETG